MSQLKKALEKKIDKQFRQGVLTEGDIKRIAKNAAIRLKERRRVAKERERMFRQS